MNNSKKVLLSLLVLGLLTTVVTVGTFALFTASTSNSNNVFATGTLSMSNSNGASATATLSNMVPGDTVTGLISINNSGSEDITSYQLSTAATAGSPSNPNALTIDTTKGLQIWVSRCSQAWTGSGASATCGGVQSDVLGTSASPVAIIQNNASLAANAFCSTNAAAIAQRATRGITCSLTGTDYLKVRVSLPSSADNSFQGLSSTISLNFNGQQPNSANF